MVVVKDVHQSDANHQCHLGVNQHLVTKRVIETSNLISILVVNVNANKKRTMRAAGTTYRLRTLKGGLSMGRSLKKGPFADGHLLTKIEKLNEGDKKQ